MRVAGQVLDDVSRSGERASCIHDPVSAAELAHQSLELDWVEERLESAFQAELMLVEGVAEERQELPSEHAAEDLEGQEEAFAAGNPARLVGADSAGGTTQCKCG